MLLMGKGVPQIRVVGIGRGGCNIVHYMLQVYMVEIEFIAIDTDAQALQPIERARRIAIGATLAKGLGTGGCADVGREAAEQCEDEIYEALKGSDMVFVVAGMGAVESTVSYPSGGSSNKDS